MNKLFRKIGMALVGMAMAVGVGVAIGNNKPIETKADPLYSTFNSTSTTNTSASDGTITSSIQSIDSSIFAVSYNQNGASNNMYIKKNDFRMYATKSSYQGNYFTVTAASGYTITSITFVEGDQTLTLGTAVVFAGAVSVSSNQVSGTSASISENSCTINSSQFTVWNNNKSVNSNTQVRFGSIIIYYTAPTPTVTSVTVTPSTAKLAPGETTDLTATVVGTNNPEQTVTWETNASGVATVSDGTVTAVATGSATITARSTVDDTKSGTATITVANKYTVTGSVANDTGSITGLPESGYVWSDELDDDLTYTLVPSDGYMLPNEITVTVAGSELDPGKLDYMYDSDDGEITIDKTKVDGNVVIEATCPAIPTYAIDYSDIDHGSATGDTSVYQLLNSEATVTISPDTDYKLPDSVTVKSNNVTLTEDTDYLYDSSTGVVSIFITNNYHGNIKVSAAMVAKVVNDIDVTATNVTADNNNPETVKEGASVTLHFTANDGYALPDSVTVTDVASSNWDKGTGNLQITGGTSGDILVSISGVAKTLSSITLSSNSGTYVLGDTFVAPTVTAHFDVGGETVDEVVTASYSCGKLEKGIFIAMGDQTVRFTYTFGGVTKTVDYTATVGKVTESDESCSKVTASKANWAGTYVIASASYMLGTTVSSDRIANETAPTVEDGVVTSTITDAMKWIIAATTGGYTIQNVGTKAYLAATGTDNKAALPTSTNEYTTWTISYDSGFVITNNAMSAAKKNATLRNNGTFGWASYGGSTGSAPILYEYHAAVVKSVYRITAELKSGTYYQGDSVSASDFTVTAHYNNNTSGTVTTNITVTNGTLEDVGTNTVTLTYEGKSCTVDVTAVERTAALVGLTWEQAGLTVIDGDTIDFSKLATVTAQYDTDDDGDADDEATKVIGSCEVGLYESTSDDEPAYELEDGDAFDIDIHDGLYLGVSYTENEVTKIAYASSVMTIVERLGSIMTRNNNSYTHAFSTKLDAYSTSLTLSNVAWTVGYTWDSSASAVQNVDGTKGQQFGTSNNYLTGLTFQTSAFSGKVSSIVVNTSGASKINGTITASVGGNAYTTTSTELTSSNTAYTFTGSSNGTVLLTWSNSGAAAIYIKSIVVNYVSGIECANTNATVQKAVLDFVGTMNQDLEVCGSYSLTSDIWAALEVKYNAAKDALSTDEEALFANMFKYATATERDAEGEADSGDTLQNALARYDYILKTYGTSTYGDFLDRVAAGTLSLSGNVSSFYGVSSGDKTMPLILAIIAGGALAAGGLLLFQRKRRNEE